jgi:phytoene dehydrogenase-like protein
MGKILPITRRGFVSKTLQAIGLAAYMPSLQSCVPKELRGGIVGANGMLGHKLRDMKFSSPMSETKTDIVIVGGGVAGLSAARILKRHKADFLLLEMEQKAGGNSIGSDGAASFPWGAHYLPLPGTGDAELISFLSSVDVITGTENGKPVFNEYYLCHDPKERLFINHLWQDGIVPHVGVPAKDREEIQRFQELMHGYRDMKGSDGRPAFDIPVSHSSRDKVFTDLDRISARDFLTEHNFRSPYLHWYVSYCCADDYGSALSETSAWAMIHYFASRTGVAANAPSDSVLTWPEGNYWLVKAMQRGLESNIKRDSLVFSVAKEDGKYVVAFLNAKDNTCHRIIAEKVIMATPQFVTERLLWSRQRNVELQRFTYAPWMVANIHTTHSLTERRGEPLCWDNVIYGSDGLGYIHAGHQNIGMPTKDKTITYYKPLTGDATTARKAAFGKKFEDWSTIVLADLQKPHPEIRKEITEMNIWIWGHGMIKPIPDFIWSENLANASTPVNDRIFFAHSDLSGISIFEEAFYHGHKAANAALGYAEK